MNRLIAVLALLLLTASLTHACSCVYDSRPASVRILEAKSLDYAIFYGRVVDVKEAGMLTITLKVGKAWSSDIASYVTVTTNPGGGSCGYPLTIDQDYLVVASRDEDGMNLSQCGLSGLTQSGFPLEYQQALGQGYFPRNYTALWWECGITLWLTTFVLLKLRSHRKL